jgi:DNA-binding NarL/FixJ family response regulator
MREGTRVALEQCSDMEVVGEAEEGAAALELIERLQPEVAILDIRMPKMNGIEVVQRMKESSPSTAALMLTAYDDDDYILALMEAGALGYLLKTARSSELIDAVRRVRLGEPVLHPEIARRVARLWAKQRGPADEGQSEQLSPREMTVLQLAARGLRNRAIAEELGISVRTAEGHFRSILSRLRVTSRVEAILYAFSHNLVTKEDSDRA